MSDMNPHDAIPHDPPPATAEAGQHSRRAFLFKLSLALNAAVGAVLAVPLVGYLLGPALRRASGQGAWVSLGPLDSFVLPILGAVHPGRRDVDVGIF